MNIIRKFSLGHKKTRPKCEAESKANAHFKIVSYFTAVKKQKD